LASARVNRNYFRRRSRRYRGNATLREDVERLPGL
jgi:hypothetical protein